MIRPVCAGLLALAFCSASPGVSAAAEDFSLAPSKRGPLSAPSDAWRPTLVRGTCVTPEYPLASIRQQEAGTSVIQLTVDAQGAVSRSVVLKSSGSARLDQAAADAFWTCRFIAAQDATGTNVASSHAMTFDWRLENAPPDPWVDLRALKGGGFMPTADLAKLTVTGDSATAPEERSKMLRAVLAEAVDKAQCPSIEQVATRVVSTEVKRERRSLELWTLKQCGGVMRYAAVITFPAGERPWFHMVPLAPSQADPLAPR